MEKNKQQKALYILFSFIVFVLAFTACQKVSTSPIEPQFVCYFYHRADTLDKTDCFEEQRWQVYRDVECPKPISEAWSRIHDSIFAFVLEDTTQYGIEELAVLSDYLHVVVKDTESTYSYQHNDYASLRTYYLSDSLYGYYCHTKWFDMGNHGTEGYYYRYFDTRSGEPLTIKNMLTCDSGLSGYINDQIRHSDKAWGILADTIRPNDNFIITDDGLIFVYNQYEIACYAVDTIMCFVPLEEFQPFIKEEYSNLW